MVSNTEKVEQMRDDFIRYKHKPYYEQPTKSMVMNSEVLHTMRCKYATSSAIRQCLINYEGRLLACHRFRRTNFDDDLGFGAPATVKLNRLNFRYQVDELVRFFRPLKDVVLCCRLQTETDTMNNSIIFYLFNPRFVWKRALTKLRIILAINREIRRLIEIKYGPQSAAYFKCKKNFEKSQKNNCLQPQN